MSENYSLNGRPHYISIYFFAWKESSFQYKKKIGLKYVYMYVSGTPEISLTEMPFHPPANLRVDLLLSRAKHITDDKVVK